MEKRFEGVLKLEELRKKQQLNIELLKQVNQLRLTVGLSDSTFDEMIVKINESTDEIKKQILELKENL